MTERRRFWSVAALLYIAIAIGLVLATNVDARKPPHPHATPTPVATPVPTPMPVPTPTPVPSWTEGFNTDLGIFVPFDHQYTDLHVTASQCTVSGGLLHLTARYIGEGRWDSCMVLTNRTFDHGFFEARVRFPAGLYDAAFWLRRNPLPPTPRSEIDIVEAYPFDNGRCPGPTKYQATLHRNDGTWSQFTPSFGHDAVGEWHTYAAEWLPGSRLVFYLDGIAVGTITTGVPAATDTMDISLSLAVGTAVWCGTANPGNDTPTLGVMDVDWVHWRDQR